MTKNELADALASKTQLTKSQSVIAIDELIEAAKEAFFRGNNIYLRGFGTFKCVRRAAKTARLISKGTTIRIPERIAVKFIPCKELKELVK